jgi:putative ABC transport system substrate-binding protein
VQTLQQYGWADGRNVRIDTRWGAGDANNFRKYAEELVALAPDVILAVGTTATKPLQQATQLRSPNFVGALYFRRSNRGRLP